MLFIILFLHQTTTALFLTIVLQCCLSSCSYIKPQRCPGKPASEAVVYHLVPTSNHNQLFRPFAKASVVYHLVPTSNHNSGENPTAITDVVYHLVPTSNHNLDANLFLHLMLFIILFLHQTTTMGFRRRQVSALFIILFLHQTTTLVGVGRRVALLFIILFLHQTTTHLLVALPNSRCLSSCSYIKPQPIAVNLLVISKILRFELIRNGRAGRFLLQIY